MKSLNIYFFRLVVCFFMCLNYNVSTLCVGSEAASDKAADSSTVRIIKDVSLSYLLLMCVTAAREVGYALAIKGLYGESCPINVGSSCSDSKAVYSCPGFALRYPLMPTGFVASHNLGNDPYKDIAIYLSGPVIGSLASYIFSKILKKMYPNESEYELAKEIMDVHVWGQYLSLIPFPGWDGERVLSAMQKIARS